MPRRPRAREPAAVRYARRMAPARLAALVVTLVALPAVGTWSGCGAKSGLRLGEPDAAIDSGSPDVVDEPPDVPPPLDAGADTEPDVPMPQDCDDAGPPSVYVVMKQSLLYRFDPPSATFNHIGTLFCGMEYAPFSMAVARNGTAYVINDGGYLFEVSTKNAACKLTGYVPKQLGWTWLGMGFVFDPAGEKDTLYVTDSTYAAPSKGLATLDLSSLKLGFVGPYTESIGEAVELTGTGDGRLFAFGLPTKTQSGTLAEIDEATGAVLSKVSLSIGQPESDFAFAWWGGDFYFFANQGISEPTEVTRYRPSDGSLTVVAKHSFSVVGAGVSTCAPY